MDTTLRRQLFFLNKTDDNMIFAFGFKGHIYRDIIHCDMHALNLAWWKEKRKENKKMKTTY